MPFDGCITPYDSVCELLNTEFVDFDKNLIVKGKNIVNTKLKIVEVYMKME